MLWVVKLGGSLYDDAARLDAWLQLCAHAGAGRVVVVPGGGRFADSVRSEQTRLGFDDLAAHNMALLAMAQAAEMLHSREPALRLVRDADALPDALRDGSAALWQPFDALRDAPDASTGWHVTSDSLAAWLAQRLCARQLVLVKWEAAPPHQQIEELVEAGYVDRAFDVHARRYAGPIAFVARDRVDALRGWLARGAAPAAS